MCTSLVRMERKDPPRGAPRDNSFRRPRSEVHSHLQQLVVEYGRTASLPDNRDASRTPPVTVLAGLPACVPLVFLRYASPRRRPQRLPHRDRLRDPRGRAAALPGHPAHHAHDLRRPFPRHRRTLPAGHSAHLDGPLARLRDRVRPVHHPGVRARPRPDPGGCAGGGEDNAGPRNARFS